MTSTAMTTATNPRIGSVHDTMLWTVGLNLDTKNNTAPTDTLCFWPENFKEMQRQHEPLKHGFLIKQRLELGEGAKTSVSLMTWITWVLMVFMTA